MDLPALDKQRRGRRAQQRPGGFSFVYLEARRGRNQAALWKRGSSQPCPRDGCHPLWLKWLPRVSGRCLPPLTPSHGAHSTLRGGGWWFRAPEPAGREAGAGWGGEKAGSQAPRAWPGLPELALRGAFPWWGLSCGLSAPEGTTGGHVPRRAGKPWAIGGSRYAVRPCP